ncbi:probable RNA polymerase II nuclear localization protein SLC7A6OS [Centruroides sculpturatus]|uniref:probable RNA polymerase II nuclear localization protein SLC7A6OS n=1 Tax=Centruroides sculpturatus TaxID=218467 RepID=UPI000C6D89F0|nr:probable RNA polymerase II nuclear localization protein SLC7A6OS [Centruroides sculpturatus]
MLLLMFMCVKSSLRGSKQKIFLEDAPQFGRPPAIDDDAITALIQENSYYATRKIAERVEDRITCNGLPLLKSEEIEYVYDLYYSPDADFDSQAIENVVSIKGCTLENDLVYPDGDDDDQCFDDDDSNDEDNWRNDYPEEDPLFERNLDYFGDYDEIEEEFLERIRDCDIASDEYCSDDDNDYGSSNDFDHNYAKYKTHISQTVDDDI